MINISEIKDKIKITAELELLTGMHIGTNDGISGIGAVDSMVIRDPLTARTMIPGSSLKGKLRRLLLNEQGQKDIESCIELERLFGGSKKNPETNAIQPARLQISDSFLTEESANKLEEKQLDLPYTEVKFENTINSITMEAFPRQVERAVKGSKYEVIIYYTLQEIDQVIEDFENIAKGFKLLQLDYIGGHGTRGYGRIKWNKIEIEVIKIKGVNLIEDIEPKLNEIMQSVIQ